MVISRRCSPNSAALQEHKRRVILITGPNTPFKRLTITPQVIPKARSVFMLATGSAKAAMLCSALNNPNDIAALPARLTLGGTWLMDHRPYLNNNAFFKKLNFTGEVNEKSY